MPGTASGLTEASSAPARNVNKPMAPMPPGQGSSESSRPGMSSSSRNYPDVTAGIVDIYDPGSVTTEAELIENDIVPDYPMDSLPRHASTMSLPNPGSSTAAAISVQTGRVSESRTNNPRSSNSVQSVIPITSLSSSVGNIPTQAPVPVSSVTAHVPITMSPHVALPHSSHSLSNPSVSHSNVNVSVTAAGPVVGDPRQIRTQDINVGIVSRLDHQRQGGNILPDLVTNTQPPPAPHHVPTSSQRPQLQPGDPRAAMSPSHRHVDPRYRQHRDRRHGRSRRHSHRHSTTEGTEEPCKESCYKCLAVGTSFRWILVVLSLLGVCCVVTGIVLAALHAAGNSFLFLAIMFIGLGVLLVVVVGVGWKCTPRGHEPLHALFSLGEFRHSRRSRRRRHRRREGRWHGGPMYPEFQFRRPPPSYNASMQEYQHQLMVAQQSQPNDIYDPDNIPDEDYSLPSSPPPSYRSRASTVRAGIQITFPPNQGGDFPDSRPPTYRSHPSNTLQGRHSRPSLSRDDDNDEESSAPADVAFTGSSVIVDTNNSQNATNIQISPLVSNQNVTVSVTTVSVTTSQPSQSAHQVQQPATPGGAVEEEMVDPVGEGEADRVETAL
ncbi:hypothetical protein ACF0H5_001640 [Mactra antiquata]